MTFQFTPKIYGSTTSLANLSLLQKSFLPNSFFDRIFVFLTLRIYIATSIEFWCEYEELQHKFGLSLFRLLFCFVLFELLFSFKPTVPIPKLHTSFFVCAILNTFYVQSHRWNFLKKKKQEQHSSSHPKLGSRLSHFSNSLLPLICCFNVGTQKILFNNFLSDFIACFFKQKLCISIKA